MRTQTTWKSKRTDIFYQQTDDGHILPRDRQTDIFYQQMDIWPIKQRRVIDSVDVHKKVKYIIFYVIRYRGGGAKPKRASSQPVRKQ